METGCSERGLCACLVLWFCLYVNKKTASSWKLGILARLLYECFPTLFICSVVRGEVLHASLCLQQQPKRREKHTLWLTHHHPWPSCSWNHSLSTKPLYYPQKSYKSHLPKRLLVKVLHSSQSHSTISHVHVSARIMSLCLNFLQRYTIRTSDWPNLTRRRSQELLLTNNNLKLQTFTSAIFQSFSATHAQTSLLLLFTIHFCCL